MSVPKLDRERVLSVVKTYGPATSSILAPKLGCSSRQAGSFLGALARIGVISRDLTWCSRTYKERWIYYVPDCGRKSIAIPIKTRTRNARRGYGDPLSLGGVDDEHLEWMRHWQQRAEQRKAMRQERRHAG